MNNGSDPNLLQRYPTDASMVLLPALWKLQKNPDGKTFTFTCFTSCGNAVTGTGCMDRRTNSPGDVQVINCNGVDMQKWVLIPEPVAGARKRKN
jgi:hypothetical protein